MGSSVLIEVEIWSDFLCPFCYIGKKNFEKALAIWKNPPAIKIVHRSFELDASAEKSQKISIYEMLAQRYGRSVEWAKAANQQMTQTAQAAGLTFNMDLVRPTNSFDAHRLAYMADQHEKRDQVHELLFSAYFTEGLDIADAAVLKSIAVKAGLSETEVTQMLSSSDFSDQVRHDEGEAYNIGVTGVPFFVFNRRLAVSGAQPPEAFLQALQQL